nr:MAG TPA: hypothetical protein [Caudoviricetes sp.]
MCKIAIVISIIIIYYNSEYIFITFRRILV